MDENTQKLWEKFSTSLKNPKTKAYYRHDICEYACYIRKPFYNSLEEDVEKYYKKLRTDISENRVTGGTVLRKYKVLSRFSAKCLCMEEYPKEALMKENLFLPYISFLRIYDRTNYAKTLSISGIDRFLSFCRDDLLLYAAVTVVCRIGLSVPEVCRIKCMDIFREGSGNWYFSLVRKKQKYMVYIPSDVKEVLLQYESRCRAPATDGSEAYFLYKNKIPLSERVLEKKIQKVAKEAGIPGYSLRDIRNSSAVLMFAYGAEDTEVSDQLGVQVQSVQRYRTGLTDMEISQQASDLVNLRVLPSYRQS